MVGGEEGWVKLIGDGSGWGWVLSVDISVCHHRCIILTLCTYPTCYVYSE